MPGVPGGHLSGLMTAGRFRGEPTKVTLRAWVLPEPLVRHSLRPCGPRIWAISQTTQRLGQVPGPRGASMPHRQQLELEKLCRLEVGQGRGYGRPHFPEVTTEGPGQGSHGKEKWSRTPATGDPRGGRGGRGGGKHSPQPLGDTHSPPWTPPLLAWMNCGLLPNRLWVLGGARPPTQSSQFPGSQVPASPWDNSEIEAQKGAVACREWPGQRDSQRRVQLWDRSPYGLGFYSRKNEEKELETAQSFLTHVGA